MNKVRVGISVGDINGVGPEVIIKTLSDARILKQCIPIIYGSAKVISYHKNIVKPRDFLYQSLTTAERPSTSKINIVNCWTEDVVIALGTPNESTGRFAYTSLDRAAQDLEAGLIDALVTAPFDKQVMSQAGFRYPGHTEYLTSRFKANESLMMMVSNGLRIGVLTNHLPISEVAESITRERVTRKLEIFHQSLKVDFGIERPTIAVLGLNPHAGDGGLVGHEEVEVIKPAMIALKKKGMVVSGPYSADGFFGTGQHVKVDGILAMYHDQGLIPFKTLSFGEGVNYTAGLNIVRTSPDHGTGVKIAGQNKANPASFRKALFLAIDLHKARTAYKEAHQNPLRKKNIREETEAESLAQDDIIDEAV